MPLIVMLNGAFGVGKTTFARPAFAVQLDADLAEAVLVTVPPHGEG